MKKLKPQYKHAYPRYSDDHRWMVYPYLKSSAFRRFSTKQEKSYYFLHRLEYKDSIYPLKLRAARGKQLISNWDDLPVTAYELAKSWKHNSRRKSQYFRASEMIDLAMMEE